MEEEEEEEEKEEKEEEEEVYDTPMAPQAEADTCEDVPQTEPQAPAEPEDKPCRLVEISQLIPAQETPEEEEEDRDSWEVRRESFLFVKEKKKHFFAKLF